jgi:hypothetical protein
MGPVRRRFAALSLMVLALSHAPSLLGASTLDDLKARFNQDAGVLRLVVLVSPTCPACVSGAGWIQEYALKRNPALDVKVYAIWYEMYPGDSPDDFPAARTLMPDRRVTHFWDPGKDVGRWFYGFVPSDVRGEIEWDAFYLFDKTSAWNDKPTDLLTSGRTILEDRRNLTSKIAELLGGRRNDAGDPAAAVQP